MADNTPENKGPQGPSPDKRGSFSIIDKDGNVLEIGASGTMSVSNYYFEVGENNILGKSFVHKFGRNPDIDTASGFEAIWGGGGDYTGFDSTAAQTVEILSSDAVDAGTSVSNGTATGGSDTTIVDTGATFVSDGVAVGDIILNDTDKSHGIIAEVTSETTLTVVRFDKGGSFQGTAESGDTYRVATTASTGAAVVELQNLLDSDLANETSEFLILNGTTGVTTTGTYLRNSRVSVILAGSGGSNAGTLTSRQSTTTANIFTLMPIGYNQTMIAAYTVPTDKEAHITGWYAGLAGKTQANCNIRLVIKHRGEVFSVQEEFAIAGAGSSYVKRDYLVPKNEIPPGSDIKIMADTDANDTAIAAGFDLILSDD